MMTDENHEKSPSQLGQNRDLNSELSDYESSVMISIGAALCAFKNSVTYALHSRWELE